MKKLPLLVLSLFVITACSAQNRDRGPERTRTLDVSGFTKLDLGSAFRINVERGSGYRVEVRGLEDDLDDLEYGVSRGKLRIGYKNNSWRKNRETVRVDITMPELDGVSFSGACNARVEGFEGGRSMSIDVSGASRVTMDFSADEVVMDLSGASRLSLRGEGETLSGDLSGASTFDGQDFPVREVTLDASGASTASVKADDSIRAEASGASRIRYSGKASQVRASTSGASSVSRND